MEGMQMKENTRRKTGQQKKIIFGVDFLHLKR